MRDAAGAPLGTFRKDFGQSLLRSTFHLSAPGLEATGQERNQVVGDPAPVRRLPVRLPLRLRRPGDRRRRDELGAPDVAARPLPRHGPGPAPRLPARAPSMAVGLDVAARPLTPTRTPVGVVRAPASLHAMRVHLGSDHAGLELKDHLVAWLREQGHEPVDHGRSSTTRTTTTRCSACAPPRRSSADDGQPRRRDRRVGQRRADRGQQGRRASAPRWPGATRRRRWPASTTTPTSSPSAAGCTPLEEMTRFVGIFLRHRLHGRGAARPPHRDARRLRDDRRPAAAARTRRVGPRCLRGTPSAGSPTTSRAAFAGRPVAGRAARRAGSPRTPRCSTAMPLARGRLRRQAPVRGVRGDRVVHVHLGLIGKFDLLAGARLPTRSGRCGCAWQDDDGVRRPPRRHPVRPGRPPSARQT